jgi:hypothetical protein
MKRVMSAPVGASRASQQQLGSSSGGAGTIGTAAYHPRSTNVALDPVCRYLLFSRCPCLIFYRSSNFFFLNVFVSSNKEALAAALQGELPAFTAKYPVRPKAFVTDRVWEGGRAVQGVVADASECLFSAKDACISIICHSPSATDHCVCAVRDSVQQVLGGPLLPTICPPRSCY